MALQFNSSFVIGILESWELSLGSALSPSLDPLPNESASSSSSSFGFSSTGLLIMGPSFSSSSSSSSHFVEMIRTMLARFRDMKRAEQFGDPTKERRPYRTDDCTNLQEAEKWRRHVIRDISKKVTQIQNRMSLLPPLLLSRLLSSLCVFDSWTWGVPDS